MTGRECKKILRERKLSNVLVAKEVGISPSTLGLWLNNKAPINKSKYFRIMQFLGKEY